MGRFRSAGSVQTNRVAINYVCMPGMPTAMLMEWQLFRSVPDCWMSNVFHYFPCCCSIWVATLEHFSSAKYRYPAASQHVDLGTGPPSLPGSSYNAGHCNTYYSTIYGNTHATDRSSWESLQCCWLN